MKPDLRHILDEIANQKAERHIAMQPPCSPGELRSLRQSLVNQFHFEMPEGYRELLEMTNGIDFNGTVIFAAAAAPHAGRPGKFIEGLLEANRVRRENAAQFLIFGESGMEMYAYDFDSKAWQTVDQVSLDAYETFDSFDDLMIAALGKRLA